MKTGDLVRWVSSAFAEKDPRAQANGRWGVIQDRWQRNEFHMVAVLHPYWGSTLVTGYLHDLLRLDVNRMTDEECAELMRWELSSGSR